MATFSVNDTARKANATANGTAVDFTFSFQVNATSDIDVYLNNVLQTSGFSIVDSTGSAGLNADGTGVVRFASAPANTTIVSLKSDVPVGRTSVYTSGGNITAAALEGDFDTLTMQIGDQEEKLARALVVPVSDADADFTIPDKDTRKGKTLSFDATTGLPTVSDSAVSSASVASTTTLGSGASATATATYASNTGDIEFTFGIPTGATGPAGASGVFSAIATKLEAEAGTENTKGMTALRVSEAITAQVSGVTAVASKFFGVKKRVEHVTLHGQNFYRTILVQEHTLVGGSENLVISDYDTYFFATGSVGLSLRANDGHLLIDLP
jgi:hypothetical protein